MGRHKIYTRKQFLKAYRKAKNYEELASLLNISIPTAHNYVKQHFKVKPYLRKNKKKKKKKKKEKCKYNLDSFEIARGYQYDVTIENLADHYKAPWSLIRTHLMKFIRQPQKYRLSKKHSPPKKLAHIKVINALIRDPALEDDPRPMLELPGFNEKNINDFWRYSFHQCLKDYEILDKI